MKTIVKHTFRFETDAWDFLFAMQEKGHTVTFFRDYDEFVVSYAAS